MQTVFLISLILESLATWHGLQYACQFPNREKDWPWAVQWSLQSNLLVGWGTSGSEEGSGKDGVLYKYLKGFDANKFERHMPFGYDLNGFLHA